MAWNFEVANPVRLTSIVRFLSSDECYDLIFRRWQAERQVALDAQVGRALSLPAHEPHGFERARGALAPLQPRVNACAPITCFVVGHAPDCECATL